MFTPLIPATHVPHRLEGSLLAGVVPVFVWLLLWLAVAGAVLGPLDALLAAGV
jgi:hypothetical protein